MTEFRRYRILAKIKHGPIKYAELAYSAYTTAREERYQKQTQAITDEVAA